MGKKACVRRKACTDLSSFAVTSSLQTTTASTFSGDVAQSVHLAVELAWPVGVGSAARALPLDVARARHDAELTERGAIPGSDYLLAGGEEVAPGFEWRPATFRRQRLNTLRSARHAVEADLGGGQRPAQRTGEQQVDPGLACGLSGPQLRVELPRLRLA